MARNARSEARKKVGIRVDEPLYEEFKEAVAVRTHKQHGMSDEFERLMKAYIKSNIGRHDEAEGITSDRHLDEDMNTTQLGNMKKNVSSHNENVIDEETESVTIQRTAKVDVNDEIIALYNYFVKEQGLGGDISAFVNYSVKQFWVESGYSIQR